MSKIIQFPSALKPKEDLVYPILEVRGKSRLTNEEKLIGPCCYHGLLDGQDDTDLSGMGLSILGNMVKGLKSGVINRNWHYQIALQMDPGSDVIPIPWPGMPSDEPIPLNVELLPLDHTMFLDKSQNKFMRRMDRIEVMQRIDKMWVPHIRRLMMAHGAYARAAK